MWPSSSLCSEFQPTRCSSTPPYQLQISLHLRTFRTSKTGIEVLRMTPPATLPISQQLKPERPRVDMMIRSTLFATADWVISTGAFPYEDVLEMLHDSPPGSDCSQIAQPHICRRQNQRHEGRGQAVAQEMLETDGMTTLLSQVRYHNIRRSAYQGDVAS